MSAIYHYHYGWFKYITDKYGDSDLFEPPVVIPKGAGFTDMIAMKGKPDIGDRINKEVIVPLVAANSRLARSDFPDFNDPNKLGEGKEMVDRLTNLIGIVLCHRKNDALVELALPENANIFASKYQLYLPSKEELKVRLEQITHELEKEQPSNPFFPYPQSS